MKKLRNIVTIAIIIAALTNVHAEDKKEESAAENKEESSTEIKVIPGLDENVKVTDVFKACDEGNKDSCYAAAVYLHGGIHSKMKMGDARKYYSKACALDHPRACMVLGILEDKGWGGDTEIKKSREHYEKACDLGMKISCDLIPDGVENRKILKSRCDAGKIRSCIKYAGYWLNGTGGPRKAKKAEAYFRKACEAGEETACSTYASMANTDKGFAEQNKRDLMACIQGFISVPADRGEVCPAEWRFMENLPVDLKEARKKLDELCKKENVDACHNLAGMMEAGLGGKKNKKKAASIRKNMDKVHKNNCNNGSGNSCFALKKYNMAISMFEADCNNGDSEACFKIALVHFEQDRKENAADAALKACHDGSGIACNFLREKWIDDNAYDEYERRGDYNGVHNKAQGAYYSLSRLHGLTRWQTSGGGHDNPNLGLCQCIRPMEGLKGNFPKVQEALEKLCESGNADACFNIASIQGCSTRKENIQKKYYNLACDLGDAESCAGGDWGIINRNLEACLFGKKDSCNPEVIAQQN